MDLTKFVINFAVLTGYFFKASIMQQQVHFSDYYGMSGDYSGRLLGALTII